MQRHISRAELERRVNRDALRRQNEINLDSTADGKAVAYFALNDIVLIGDGHGELPGLIAICDDTADLIGGKIQVKKARGVDAGLLTISANTQNKTLLQEMAHEIQQFSRKNIKFVFVKAQ